MKASQINHILKRARIQINKYLDESLESGNIDGQLYKDAQKHLFENLEEWLRCPKIEGVSLSYKDVIAEYIGHGGAKSRNREKIRNLVNAYRQEVRFGTGGIRGMMAFDKKSILALKNEGLGARVLKGPNTMNDLVMMKTTAGVAKYGISKKPRLKKVVVGYDSRIRGYDLARAVAQVFLAYGYKVYFFDAPCPYPEVTFAIPHKSVKADIGVLISASHNDYRYNGYKLSCSNGSQFDPEERNEMFDDFISKVKFKDIKILPFDQAPTKRLKFLGGSEPVKGFQYYGRENDIYDMHSEHLDHVKKFLLTSDLAQRQNTAEDPLNIAYCPFHGAGYIAVYKLLKDVGFQVIKKINGSQDLYRLNGMFPAFEDAPGREQQPDPGDPRAAETAVEAFKYDYSGKEFNDVDIVIGTDPDADRCGIVVKIPANQKHAYNHKDHYLLPADDMWTLVMWYRLHKEKEKHGRIRNAEKKFIVMSHTTSDSITYLARKNGIGLVKSWVGFAALAAVTRDVWESRDKVNRFSELVDGRDLHCIEGRENYIDICHEFVCQSYDMNNGKRSFNIAAMEQSNGFSILGGKPPDANSLGVDGHVRDKDGTFAALLVAEIAAWAKERGTSIVELLDKHIYLDKDIGLFATFYEPDPLDGEYPGIEGDRIKKNILRRALAMYQLAMAGDLEIAGLPVVSAAIYRTGKYDLIYPPEHDFAFPDEGIRFYFDNAKRQHLTIRPSGTGNSLRFHIQLHDFPTKKNLVDNKVRLRIKGRGIMDELRERLKAPRE